MSAGTLGSVAIVGAGQTGTALGIALASSGATGEIVLFDRDDATARHSLALGAGHRTVARIEDALRADIVILAVPVSAIVALVDAYGGTLRPGTLLLDTGSAKRAVVEAMGRSVDPAVHAIGGHPVAGTERPGPDGADPATLQGATFALCPVRDDPEALRLACLLVGAVGAEAVVIDATAHDRAIARTIGLPHLLSFALTAAVRSEGVAASGLAGPGLRGATRLAHSDPLMVAALLAANAPETRAAVAGLRVALDALVASLDDEGALAAALADAAR